MHSLAHTERPTAVVDHELASRVARVADRTELGSLRTPAPATPATPVAPGPHQGDTGPLRFRGATYDAAVQAAEDALGVRPHVLAAHRIRRGGIGGFFATDLGVEVQVEVPGETVDEAVERLVESGSTDDRATWIRELARAAGIDIVDASAAPPTDIPATSIAPAAPPAPATANEPVDEYLDDLVFERPARPVAASSPAPSTDVRLAATGIEQLDHAAPTLTADHVDRVEPVEPADHVEPVVHVDHVEHTPSTPTRRQVDLAVVAASEMIRLTGDQAPGTTVSIQVTVSTADGRSVSAEARIESPTPKPARRTATRNGGTR